MNLDLARYNQKPLNRNNEKLPEFSASIKNKRVKRKMPKMNDQQLSQSMGKMDFYEQVGDALYETDPKIKCQK